jgi:hypothetical protein
MLTFLTPLGGITAAAALLPVAAAVVAARRSERAARVLRLAPARRRTFLAPALVAAVACVCAGLAAAQPTLRTTKRLTVRTQSEILYVVDVSRSMAAAPSAGGESRLARARDVVRRLHDAVPDVPSGLVGFTDRVLPYLFATSDAAVFDETLRRSVLIESPPPQEVERNATTFDALPDLAGVGFFDRSARRRTCVLVTDGESRPYAAGDLSGTLPCRLVVVRVGSTSDRVFGADGVPEAAYAPDPAAVAKVRALADAAGGRAFDETQLGAAAAAVRADAEAGPAVPVATRTIHRALAPWLALAALVLALATVAIRLQRISLRRVTISHYTGSVTAPTKAVR